MKARRLILLFALVLVVIGLEVLLLSRGSRRESVESLPPAATDVPVSQAFVRPTEQPPAASPGTATVLLPTAEPTPTVSPAPTALPELTPIVMTPAPGEDAAPAPSAEALPTATPVPTPTQAPAATPEPTPTPAPTPTLTPSPTTLPSGTETGQGTFSSSTGTSLDMSVTWEAFDNGDGTTLIAVSGDIGSYSLELSALYQGITIDLGGYGVTCDSLGVNVSSDAGFAMNHLFTTSFTVPTGTEGTMNVSWRYGGTYGGVSLPSITASGYVSTG